MSKGYGAVQRHVLARLAANTADPAADHDTLPYHQSWTSLHDLRAGTPFHDESVRRAISKLAAAGLVETRLLRRVRWWSTDDPNTPGAIRPHAAAEGMGTIRTVLLALPDAPGQCATPCPSGATEAGPAVFVALRAIQGRLPGG
jgi:hypothetical protein